MSCCSHCQDAETFFTDRKAEKELKRYRKKGPSKSTRLLLDAIRDNGFSVGRASLIDVGGGVGAIPMELFKDGLGRATNVDASKPYIAAARQAMEERGWADRASFHFGDAAEVVPELEAADIVTLDRVICCYPHPKQLIEATAYRANRLYGVVFPRDWWFTRIGMKLGNAWSRWKGSDFRTYLFDPPYIRKLIRRQGFTCRYHEHTILWHVMLYERNSQP